MGPVGIDVYLVGDVNGNNHVGALDLALIRSLRGVRQGQSGYSRSADVNGDGVINGRDWQLARSNLGVSTRCAPYQPRSPSRRPRTRVAPASSRRPPSSSRARPSRGRRSARLRCLRECNRGCAHDEGRRSRELSALDQHPDDRSDSRADPGHGSFRADGHRNDFDRTRRRGHRLGSNSDRGDPGRESERRPGLACHGDGHGFGLRRRQRHRPRACRLPHRCHGPGNHIGSGFGQCRGIRRPGGALPRPKGPLRRDPRAVTGNGPRRA